jgi:3-oxoacyl-[acyl-carrier-protein] synthase-3
LKDPTTGKFTGFRELPGSFRSRGADGSFHLNQDARQLNESIKDVTVTQMIRRSIEKHGMKNSDIDWFLPHYSSQYFREKVSAGLKCANFEIPESRWFTNLTRVGNIGSASIYVMIAEMLDKGMIERGQRILCYVPESARYSSSFMHLTAV